MNKKKEYFQKTKRFYKTFTGPVIYEGLLLHFHNGDLINAEHAPKGARAALVISESMIHVSPKIRWAKNHTLIQEFMKRAQKQLESIEIL